MEPKFWMGLVLAGLPLALMGAGVAPGAEEAPGGALAPAAREADMEPGACRLQDGDDAGTWEGREGRRGRKDRKGRGGRGRGPHGGGFGFRGFLVGADGENHLAMLRPGFGRGRRGPGSQEGEAAGDQDDAAATKGRKGGILRLGAERFRLTNVRHEPAQEADAALAGKERRQLATLTADLVPLRGRRPGQAGDSEEGAVEAKPAGTLKARLFAYGPPRGPRGEGNAPADLAGEDSDAEEPATAEAEDAALEGPSRGRKGRRDRKGRRGRGPRGVLVLEGTVKAGDLSGTLLLQAGPGLGGGHRGPGRGGRGRDGKGRDGRRGPRHHEGGRSWMAGPWGS